MKRRNDDRRKPRRFDPKQRGRDHTRARNRRKRGVASSWSSTERRIENLETWAYLNTSVAVQAPATTLIEVVTELPDPTYLDIGRQIILRSSAAVHDILYVGMQLPDDTIAWIQWTSIYEESPNSPEFTWNKHVTFFGTQGLFYNNSGIYITAGTQDIWRMNPTTGSVVAPVAGIPTGTNPGYGVYAEGAAGSEHMWAAVQGVDKVQYWNGSTVSSSAATQDFWGLAYDSVGARLIATDVAGNRCSTLGKTTLTVGSHFATDSSGPRGVAVDSSGNIYVADTGNNRMRKYNSSLTHQLNWGNFGFGNGQFSGPTGVAVDSGNRIYVADSGNNRIQVFDTNGTFLGKFGIGGTGGGQFSNPVDVSVNGSAIVIADAGNDRVSFWTRT